MWIPVISWKSVPVNLPWLSVGVRSKLRGS